MSTAKNWTCFAASMAVVGILMSGCSTQSSPNPASAPVAPKMSGDDGATDGLAKLSVADRAAALKQAVCPVTGAKLGSMGAPPKVVVNGQEVFLCCDGCEEKLREEPEKYLAKLKSE